MNCNYSFPLLSNNFSPETFISGLKQLRVFKSAENFSDPSAVRDGTEIAESYEYFSLSIDTSREKCTFRLPPYPYALFLLEQFTIYFRHDWHWFLQRRFRQQVDNTYIVSDCKESKDRNWLCKLLVVLAMGESANAGDPDGVHAPETRAPPGTDFFEQALNLLTIPYEEASIENIETFNLLAIHSNQLNRQKTAYIKRVWWSTYCLDRMTSTQRGLLHNLDVDQTDLELPSRSVIGDENADEFGDADYLTARIQLTIIQSRVFKGVSISPQGEVQARLGLMENIHLFTSSVVLRLAIAINTQRAGSFDLEASDRQTYEEGYDVLLYMMRCGSLAAKGHLKMLKDVGDVADAMEPTRDIGQDQGKDWDIEEWITQLLESETTSHDFNN
ncbi:hypothetical protein BDV06DRAFT_228861 [Aspergillus oleicola]